MKVTVIAVVVGGAIRALTKCLEKSLGNWRSVEELRLSRSKCCWDQLAYLKALWRPKETRSHAGSSERPLGWKTAKLWNNNNDNNNNYRKLKKKTVEPNGDSIYGWCAWNVPQRLGKKDQGTRNLRKNRDRSDDGIMKIG